MTEKIAIVIMAIVATYLFASAMSAMINETFSIITRTL